MHKFILFYYRLFSQHRDFFPFFFLSNGLQVFNKDRLNLNNNTNPH